MQSNLNRYPSLRNREEKSSGQFIHPQPVLPQAGAAGLALIRRFEGCLLHPYRCPAGWWTIGYGHRIGEKEIHLYQRGISQDQAENWLEADAGAATRAALRLTPGVQTPRELDALSSFIFNLGAAAYQRSALRLAVRRRDETAIAEQWMRWVWAGGRKLPGLVTRRAAELAWFFGEG